MFMTRLRKIGNSVGLTIDRALLKTSFLDAGDRVVVTSCGRGALKIRAVSSQGVQFLQEAGKQAMRFREALKEMWDD